MKPRFATPGERLITRGEKGDAAFFISSGAVEVRTGTDVFRLGRGDMFGEIALITGKPRTADVVALGYCQLLVLSAADYLRLVETAPDIKAQMDDMSSRRESMNANGTAEDETPEVGTSQDSTSANTPLLSQELSQGTDAMEEAAVSPEGDADPDRPKVTAEPS
ncbi:cyclic nucleotide-binding domain-containing protein [Roseibium aestuarii]|uniref:Cyclic nucleotide-binding domain-containing protein n=2 Tax=Roseibium aestuarii TaxID=2600299 RepID=A0ABW4JUK0_9HYPH